MSSRRRGTFRPFIWWLVVSSLLLLGQYHRTKSSEATVEFTVSMEGRERQIVHGATLNGLPYQAGNPCGVGWKKLIVHAKDAESFETNCFIWYGGASFGNVTLTRSRGRLELDCSPAGAILISGTEQSTNFNNTQRESVFLPTGRYKVEARFLRFNIERTVDVIRNHANHVEFNPGLTTLNLTSEPDKADFELNSKDQPEVSVRGSTPAMVVELPAGKYELTIARGDYRKKLPVTLVGAKPTNELDVQFRYARLSIASDPSNATIRDGNKVVGRTPASLDLQPGTHRLEISRDGYFGTNLDLTLSETDSRAVSVTLVNVSFVEAIERAQKHSFGGMHYDRALADLEQALLIKPGDETALALKREVEFDRHMRQAWLLERKSAYDSALVEVKAALKLDANHADALALKSELEKEKRSADEQQARNKQAAAAAQAKTQQARAEDRRQRPEKLLNEVSSRIRHHEFFDNELSRFRGSVETVHMAVLNALGRDPQWSVLRDDKMNDDLRVIVAELRGVLSMQRVVVVTGQTGEDDVLICFKLFLLTGLRGSSEDSYLPFHAKNESGTRAEMINKRLRRDIQGFKKRIDDEVLKYGKSN